MGHSPELDAILKDAKKRQAFESVSQEMKQATYGQQQGRGASGDQTAAKTPHDRSEYSGYQDNVKREEAKKPEPAPQPKKPEKDIEPER